MAVPLHLPLPFISFYSERRSVDLGALYLNISPSFMAKQACSHPYQLFQLELVGRGSGQAAMFYYHSIIVNSNNTILK